MVSAWINFNNTPRFGSGLFPLKLIGDSCSEFSCKSAILYWGRESSRLQNRQKNKNKDKDKSNNNNNNNNNNKGSTLPYYVIHREELKPPIREFVHDPVHGPIILETHEKLLLILQSFSVYLVLFVTVDKHQTMLVVLKDIQQIQKLATMGRT